MKNILKAQANTLWQVFERKGLILLLVFFWLGGCGFWNSYLHPDYGPTRAERVCHPYGDCSQGIWVAMDGSEEDTIQAKAECHGEVHQHHGYGWWEDSVSRGLKIGDCMEKKGFILQQ